MPNSFWGAKICFTIGKKFDHFKIILFGVPESHSVKKNKENTELIQIFFISTKFTSKESTLNDGGNGERIGQFKLGSFKDFLSTSYPLLLHQKACGQRKDDSEAGGGGALYSTFGFWFCFCFCFSLRVASLKILFLQIIMNRRMSMTLISCMDGQPY